MLPRREHAGYVEEELQQLVMMLPHAAGRDGDGDGGGDGGGGDGGDGGGGDSDGAVWPQLRPACSPLTSIGCGGWGAAC